MRRLLTLMVLAVMMTAPAMAGSPWWDARLDGFPVFGYDGLVVYEMEVIDAPISLPMLSGFYPGWVQADPLSFTFTDWYGNSYSGNYHPATGCYLSTDDPGEVIQAFCYDGGSRFFMLYGTLEWTGSQGVIVGPWQFIIDGQAYSGPAFRPERVYVE